LQKADPVVPVWFESDLTSRWFIWVKFKPVGVYSKYRQKWKCRGGRTVQFEKHLKGLNQESIFYTLLRFLNIT
jgi:hypothetical protein